MCSVSVVGLIDRSERDFGGDSTRKQRCDTGVVQEEEERERSEGRGRTPKRSLDETLWVDVCGGVGGGDGGGDGGFPGFEPEGEKHANVAANSAARNSFAQASGQLTEGQSLVGSRAWIARLRVWIRTS